MTYSDQVLIACSVPVVLILGSLIGAIIYGFFKD